MEIHPSTHEVLLICAVDKLCQLSKIKVIKEKKKKSFSLKFHKFEAYKLSLPEKLLNTFLMH